MSKCLHQNQNVLFGKTFQFYFQNFGAIVEYPTAREHKLHAPAVPQWPKKVMQLKPGLHSFFGTVPV